MKNINSKLFVGMIAGLLWALPASADTVKTTQTTTTVTTTYSEDLPIYTGPIVETELEQLTLADFQTMGGNKPSSAFDNFRKYKAELEDPNNTKPVMYKLKVSRPLTIADFTSPEVSPELAQKRYEIYLSNYNVKPGETYYVYVYHAPVLVAVR